MSGIPYGGGRSYGDRFQDGAESLPLPPSVYDPEDFPVAVSSLVAEFDMWPSWSQIEAGSPTTGVGRILTRQHRWNAFIVWPILLHDQAHPIAAFFHRLEGGLRPVRIEHRKYRQMIGTKAGSVSLAGAHAIDARLLTISGGTGEFRAGDYIQILASAGKPRLYQIVQGEDELGAGSIAIAPGLRVAHGDGANIDHLEDTGPLKETMYLAANLPPSPMFPGPEEGFVRPAALELISGTR